MTLAGESTKFLSLESTSSSQVCNSVPFMISGEYEGDMLGNWQTSPNFQQNNSAFMITFSGSTITNDQYRSVMSGFKDKLKVLSQKSALRDSG
jgi:hypothetical protein